MNCSFFMSFLFSFFMLCFTTPGPSRPWPKTLPLPFSCIMSDCKGVCVPICHALSGHDTQLYVALLRLFLVVLPSIYVPALYSLFFFPLQTSVCFTHRSSDCALDRQDSLNLSQFPVIINTISTDPHLKDKHDSSPHLDSWFVEIYRVNAGPL